MLYLLALGFARPRCVLRSDRMAGVITARTVQGQIHTLPPLDPLVCQVLGMNMMEIRGQVMHTFFKR